MATLREKAAIIIDLSADYRLRNPDDYPQLVRSRRIRSRTLLADFVYGIPELHREEIKESDLISSAGCMATTAILGLYPLYQAGVVDTERPAVIEAKTGSSGSGGGPGLGSHHPERSGVVRLVQADGPPPLRRDHPGVDGRWGCSRGRLLGDGDRGGARHPGDLARIPQGAADRQRDLGDLSAGLQGRAVHAPRQRGERHPSLPGTEDPLRLELLRCRLRAGPALQPPRRPGRRSTT